MERLLFSADELTREEIIDAGNLMRDRGTLTLENAILQATDVTSVAAIKRAQLLNDFSSLYHQYTGVELMRR